MSNQLWLLEKAYDFYHVRNEIVGVFTTCADAIEIAKYLVGDWLEEGEEAIIECDGMNFVVTAPSLSARYEVTPTKAFTASEYRKHQEVLDRIAVEKLAIFDEIERKGH